MRAKGRKRGLKLRRELRRIFGTLRTHDIDIRVQWLLRDRSLYGDYAVDREGNNLIRVDPYKEMVGTLVHEVLHYLDPEMSHRRIYALEQFIVRNASRRQLVRLFGYLVFRWRITLTEQRPRRPMPPCPFCGRKLPRVSGGSSPREHEEFA